MWGLPSDEDRYQRKEGGKVTGREVEGRKKRKKNGICVLKKIKSAQDTADCNDRSLQESGLKWQLSRKNNRESLSEKGLFELISEVARAGGNTLLLQEPMVTRPKVGRNLEPSRKRKGATGLERESRGQEMGRRHTGLLATVGSLDFTQRRIERH